jgi:hypothetical protein
MRLQGNSVQYQVYSYGIILLIRLECFVLSIPRHCACAYVSMLSRLVSELPRILQSGRVIRVLYDSSYYSQLSG